LSTVWQDTAGTIPAANGLDVARWDDKSLSGIVVQQGNAGDRPTYTATVANLGGLPGLYFDGGNGGDALTSTSGNTTGISGNADRTVISVWTDAVNTGQNYQHSVHFGDSTTNEAYGHSVFRGGNSLIGNHYWGSGFDSSAAGSASPTVAISSWDGDGGSSQTNGSDSFWVNGSVSGTVSRGTLATGTSQLQIGSRLNPATEGMRGQLAEIIVYDGILTQIERDRIGGYLQNKYGISIANAITDPLGPLPEAHIGGLHNYDDFADVSDWVFNGSATQNGNRLLLTPSSGSQRGSAWLNGRVMLDDDGSFNAQFAFAISNGSSDGADGLAFVLQNDVDGTGALGGGGGSVGLGGLDEALGIVIKDYQTNQIQIRRGVSDIVLASADLGGGNNGLEDGNPRYVWVDYNGTTESMEIYFSDSPVMPAAPILATSIDLLSLVGGRRDLYAGFTGGTGGAFATHEILSFNFVGVPEPGTMALLGAGLAMVARRRKRRA